MPSLEQLTEHRVVTPDADPEMIRLYQAAVERLDLPVADYLTIRDLTRYAGAAPSTALHALLLCLFAAMDEGSICLRTGPDDLAIRLGRFTTPDTAAELASQIRHLLADGSLASLTQTDTRAAPLVIPANRPDVIYFQRYYNAERDLQQLLEQRLDRDTAPCPPIPDTGRLRAIVTELCDRTPTYQGGANPEQQLALLAALIKRMVIISGGPGTGKTAIVVDLLRALARCDLPPDAILLAAPTGRAAQRLTESIRTGLYRLLDDRDQALPENRLLSLEAQTIHRLLRYHPGRNRFRHHRHNPLAAELVVVDEVSMVDVTLMRHLLDAIPDRCRLILIGDHHQLPSVDAGAVLAQLVPTETARFSHAFRELAAAIRPGLAVPAAPAVQRLTDHVVLLRHTYRSERSLLKIAAAINRAPVAGRRTRRGEAARTVADQIIATIPVLTAFAPPDTEAAPARIAWPVPRADASGRIRCRGGGCRRLPLSPDTPAAARDATRAILASWATHHYLNAPQRGARSYAQTITAASRRGPDAPDFPDHADALFRFIRRARVLAALRHSYAGTRHANRTIADILRPATDPDADTETFAGAPVIVTRNDYAKELYNGDVGVILGSRTDGYYAIFPRLGRYLRFPVDALPEHDLAFAITVHKSQGSEYDQVLLMLPDDPQHRLLTREILYTAITRARYLAVIHARHAALRNAITTTADRQSGLDLWNRRAPDDAPYQPWLLPA